LSAKVAGLVQKNAPGEPGEITLAAGNDPRQISLLRTEAREWMTSQPQPGLCFERFAANILVEALPEQALATGTLLQIGDALLEITQGKHCFEQCALASQGKQCLLKTGSVFARVTQGGRVKIGDDVAARYSRST